VELARQRDILPGYMATITVGIAFEDTWSVVRCRFHLDLDLDQ